MPTLLVVEDEAVLARNLAKAFDRLGFTVHHAPDSAAATQIAESTPPDAVLLDLRLPDGSGLDVLDALLARDPELPVIMMTAYASVADAVDAMRRGARDYIQKPLDLGEVRLKVERALRQAREGREVSYYRQRETAGTDLIGQSPEVGRVRTLIARLARATIGPGAPAPTVLLLGETGSGKGHVARSLRAAGGRSGGPFIEVNCTALPEQLVEAELFGHEKGAFTDAKQSRAGLFETAEGGTIFLDEIGHVSAALQSKFLRVLESKVVRRVGGTAERQVDVQVIAATNRDLEAAVRLGEFREDLYQRLCVAVIRIPPLREHAADALPLARAFLEEARRRYGAPARTLSAEAEKALVAHGWPGNVREVANTMERVVLFTDDDPIEPKHLGLPATTTPREATVAASPTGEISIDFPDSGISLEAVERALLASALAKAGGNQSGAARLLAISRDTLRYRLEKYGLGE